MKVYVSPEMELRRWPLLSVFTASEGEGDIKDWETDIETDPEDVDSNDNV